MKKNIGDRIKALKEDAPGISEEIQDAEEPDNKDWESDSDKAISGLKELEELPDVPPEIASIMVEHESKRCARHLDNAKEIGDELEVISVAIDEAGFGDSEFGKALDEILSSFYEF